MGRWPGSGATRSAAAMPPGLRFPRPMTSRESRSRRRRTSSPATSCNACSGPSISAGNARFSSTPTPCGRCSCCSIAPAFGSAEAQRLTFDDVDLNDAVLTIRDTKFFKNRLVPVGIQLAEVLRNHAARRKHVPLPKGMASTFLANRDGTPLAERTVRNAFARALKAAGIRHDKDDGRRSPCLHSLRHAAAVHRLESWYRQGADVQRLLPALSTWLGHAHLDGTQIYLTMTPGLLHQASVRFDSYVNGGHHE